jgi:hypothetical protein
LQHVIPRTRSGTWADDVLVCACAARAGSLACLQYAREHGNCGWNKDTCTAAAAGGSFECLRYAHDHGCPMDWSVLSAALIGDHDACLSYGREHLDDQYCLAPVFVNLECDG